LKEALEGVRLLEEKKSNEIKMRTKVKWICKGNATTKEIFVAIKEWPFRSPIT
jgi:hypothetical protein